MKAKHVFVEAKPLEFLVCNGEWQHLPAGPTDPPWGLGGVAAGAVSWAGNPAHP